MENANPSPPSPQPGRDARAFLGRFFAAIPRPDFPRLKISGRRLFLLAAIVLLAWGGYRFFRGSLREVEPGYAAISVNRLTGGLESLPPGSHWRPRALYDLHAVRVSDQLLSGPAGSFSV
jgi:hypothetical protein